MPLISCHESNNILFRNNMEGDFLLSILWEHQSLQTCCCWRKQWKQNAEFGWKLNKNMDKKPELPWNFIRWVVSTMHETLNAWNIECILGYHFLSYSVTLFKILKQMNHPQRRNSVFCFSWKVVKMQIQHFVLRPTLCLLSICELITDKNDLH